MPNPAFDLDDGHQESATNSDATSSDDDSTSEGTNGSDNSSVDVESDSTIDATSGSADPSSTVSEQTSSSSDSWTGHDKSTSTGSSTTGTTGNTSESSSTSSTEDTQTPGEDLVTGVPPLGDLLPLPSPFCPADSELLSCLSFQEAGLDVAKDGSQYAHDATGTGLLRRWVHSDAPYQFLKAGWETGSSSRISVSANNDFSFTSAVRLEVWWHRTAGTQFDEFPIVSLGDMLSIVVTETGYVCRVGVGTGGVAGYTLEAGQGDGVQYVACALKGGTLSMEVANQQVWTDTFATGVVDLTFFQPELRVLHGLDFFGKAQSQAAVVYGVRVWQREQP